MLVYLIFSSRENKNVPASFRYLKRKIRRSAAEGHSRIARAFDDSELSAA
jgi:hypothetical protein